MRSLNSLIDGDEVLVADASFVISLNASGHASSILGLRPSRWMTTQNTIEELKRGSARGHDDYRQICIWIDWGLMTPVMLGEDSEGTYENLVLGGARETLDDGEAATIAYALSVGGIALIDERKARLIARARFSDLRILSTAEVLLDPMIASVLGHDVQLQAMHNALLKGRTRVPGHVLDAVITLIGPDRAATCKSLPTAKRIRAGGSPIERRRGLAP